MFNRFAETSTIANTAGIRRLTIGVTGNDGKRVELAFVAPEFSRNNTTAPLHAVESNSQFKPTTLAQTIAIATALDELTTKYNVEPERLEKGFSLFREGKAEYRSSLDAWICVSQDNGDVYAVDLDLGLCSCGDALNRRLLCKHFIACWLTHRVGILTENLKSIVQMLGKGSGTSTKQAS